MTDRRLVLWFVLVTALVSVSACSSPTPPPINLNAPVATTAAATNPPPPSAVATNAAVTNAAQNSTIPSSSPPASFTPLGASSESPTPIGSASSSAPTDYFGVNSNGEIIYDQQVRALAIVAGVQMVRSSVSWNAIEAKKGKYSWDYFDHEAKTLLENHFTPLFMITNNPPWAANSNCGPVNDLPAFEQFVRTLAQRYPQVQYWALYNEPDNQGAPDHPGAQCFGGNDLNGNGKPDVEDYAEQLRIAWRAIHQANPHAQLVSGALAFDNFNEQTAPPGYPGGGKGGSFNYNFPQQLFQYMAAHPLPNGEKYLDILSFNFYFIYGPYWEQQVGGISISAKVNMLNKLMNDAGIHLPLLVSETGDDSVRVGNAGQSEYAVKTFTRGLASGITHMIWWTFQDFPDSAPPPVNTWKYGLIDQNKSPKPSYAAYQTASRELTEAVYQQPLSVNGGEGYLFTKNGSGKAVVWSSSDTPILVTFAGNALQVTDMYGTVKTITDGATDDKDGTVGRIGVQVTSPVYIGVRE